MISDLSLWFQDGLREFIAFWIREAPAPKQPNSEVTKSVDAILKAKLRADCRSLGDGYERARQARIDGLRAEVSARTTKDLLS